MSPSDIADAHILWVIRWAQKHGWLGPGKPWRWLPTTSAGRLRASEPTWLVGTDPKPGNRGATASGASTRKSLMTDRDPQGLTCERRPPVDWTLEVVVL